MVNNNIFVYYIIYFVLFFIAQCSSMWGQFFILKYKDITLWDAYKMAIPFAWFAWLTNDICCIYWRQIRISYF